MKRNSFLKRLLAGCAAIAAAPAALANLNPFRRDGKGFLVGAGKDRFGKSISLMEGDTFFTKVSTKDTNADLYVFESTRVKKGGPSLHYHYEQDEWWYVLEGEFLIRIGEETFTMKAGDSAFGPRGVPHTFAKTSEGPGRLLMLFQPAGKMEEWFQAVSEGKLANLSEEQQQEFRKKYGFEKVGPGIGYEKKL
ncbi:MAG: cupin domain-containing protein [Chitinophagaceae bacterium]